MTAQVKRSTSVSALKGPVVIAAGGTGGHLFPGQALSQELLRRGHRVVLITDERVQHFDRLFPGVQIFSVPAATFSGRGVFSRLAAMAKIIKGTLSSLAVLARVKPAVLIGFGGYPTLPPMLAAMLRGIPSAVHEQNAVLGRVNKLVAGRVGAVASTFPHPKYLKASAQGHLVVTGNPVRDAVRSVENIAYDAPGAEGPLKLLVFGGSQGARVMSDIVPFAIGKLPEALRDRLQVVQQCRPEDLERVKSAYDGAGVHCELNEFFDNMPSRIAEAHLVIGRSGASTISELAVIGRPSILVPLPHSIDQDQKANAEVLSKVGAAWIMDQPLFTPETLAARLTELFTHPEQLVRAAAAAKTQSSPHAVTQLADLVETLGLEGRAGVEAQVRAQISLSPSQKDISS